MIPVGVLILFFGGLFGIGAIILAGQYISSRGGGDDGETKRLTGELDALRTEMRLLQDEVHQLDERVEFTERLLERPRDADAPGSTPDSGETV